jgi:hypothetical protein
MTATNSSLSMTRDNISPTTNTNDFDDVASSGKLKINRKLHNYVHIFSHYLIISTNEERNAFSLSLYFLFPFSVVCLKNVRKTECRHTHTY